MVKTATRAGGGKTARGNALGREVRRLREAAGLSQEAIAAATGTTRAYVSQVEVGHESFKVGSEFARKLSAALRVPLGHWADLTVDGGLVDELSGLPAIGGGVWRFGPWPPGTFAVMVSGGEMGGVGICDGDVLAVEPAAAGQPGEVVIVEVGKERWVRGVAKDGKFCQCHGVGANFEWHPPKGKTATVIGVVRQVIGGARKVPI